MPHLTGMRILPACPGIMSPESSNHNQWLRWRRRGLLAIAILLLLYLLAPYLLNLFARSLVRRDLLEKADVVVALGGDRRSLREQRAAQLYLDGWARKVIVSGVEYMPGINTGDAAKRYVIHLGVPEADVIVMRDARNTRAEARLLESLMSSNGWNSAIIVTAPFHSRRALFTIKRAAPGGRFRSFPTEPVPPEWQPDYWWRRRSDMYLTIREALAWINTLLSGWE